jgi:hypothetical protein
MGEVEGGWLMKDTQEEIFSIIWSGGRNRRKTCSTESIEDGKAKSQSHNKQELG